MPQKTLRTQNKCNQCGYTWYPRGKNLSSVCPKCKSSKVRFVGSGVIGGALILGFLFLTGDHKNPPAPVADTVLPAPASAEEGLTPAEHIEQQSQLAPSLKSTAVLTVPSSASSQPTGSVTKETELKNIPTSISDQPLPSALKIFSNEEISQMEDAKQYHGDDPIVRSRLGLPSRETRQLLP